LGAVVVGNKCVGFLKTAFGASPSPSDVYGGRHKRRGPRLSQPGNGLGIDVIHLRCCFKQIACLSRRCPDVNV
jgi:hypothetical protein